MSAHRKYTLDANIFIEAKRRYYAFHLCPGFWDALIWHQKAGALGSIDKVKQELEAGGDELAAWAASTAPASCFASTDAPDTIAEFIAMVEWVQGQQQFYPEAKAEFAGGTDGWLVAHAKARELVVVTHEVYAPDGRKKVPIPNVCRAFGVPCVNTFEMLGGLQTQFTWTPPT